MSDYQHQDSSSTEASAKSKLHICLYSTKPKFAQSVVEFLNCDRYIVKDLSLIQDVVAFVSDHEEQIDCIVLIKDIQANSILEQLWQSKVFLPTVIVEIEAEGSLISTIVENEDNQSLTDISAAQAIYHQAEIRLYPTQITEISAYINLAITKFLNITSASDLGFNEPQNEPGEETRNSLILQQRRLTEKIKERLGYLGVYYKRQASSFYRNLSADKQKKFYGELSQNYRQILLEYFTDSTQINQLIDKFVDQAFFADISTSQILEIHMELIDDFSYQLQIEGRNDDILLDYRLPLIDITAHLCEMYRRSIPREDISLDLLFTVDN